MKSTPQRLRKPATPWLEEYHQHHEYERRKAEWHRQNPGASPQSVEAARRRIAQELSI